MGNKGKFYNSTDRLEGHGRVMTCFMSCWAVLTAKGAEFLGVMGLAWPQELPKPRGVDWGVPLGVGPLDPPLPLSGLHNDNTIYNL